MKKILLLSALICAGALNGMEPEHSHWESLLPELKQEIINTALTTSKSVDDAVNTIQKFGILHGVHYDTSAAIDLLIKTLPDNLDKAIETVKPLQGTTLQDFTKLAHVLADKFSLSTLTVTTKFKTPIAEQYQKLHFYLLNQSRYGNVNNIVELIQQGADINGTQTFNEEIRTPLYYAISGDNTEIVKFLVESGATQKYLPERFQEKMQSMLAKSNEK